jgi:hypothetical protein
VAEVLDDRMTFSPACLEAMRAFRRGNPWLGNFQQRACKLHALNRDLSRAYDLRPGPELVCVPGDTIGRELATQRGIQLYGADCYDRDANRIELHADSMGHLSVVTYLHEFGHARGLDEWQTCRWSVNLFRRIFPRSFARLQQVGHRLLRTGLAVWQAPSQPLTRSDQRVTVRRLDLPKADERARAETIARMEGGRLVAAVPGSNGFAAIVDVPRRPGRKARKS